MKRFVAILFVALSTSFLLIFACLPHYHHHNGGVCFAVEHCEHAGQEDASHDDGCGPFCISHAKYTPAQTDNTIKHKDPSNTIHPNHVHLFNLYSLLVDFGSLAKELSPFRPGSCERNLIYKQAGLNRLNGLRAPPFFLS